MSAAPEPPEQPDPLWDRLMQADEAGIRLEIVGGRKSWEFWPGLSHQMHVKRIDQSVTRIAGHESDCQCFSAMDVYIHFKDGSVKRPDISIFCRMSDEMDGFVTLVPKAVVEVISKGYESKDLIDGPELYLSQGVLDVVVFDPIRQRVVHFEGTGQKELPTPVTLDLKCGCRVTV